MLPLSVFTFVIFLASSVYSQVQVTLEFPPPLKFKIEDMWRLTLINPLNLQVVYLHGTVESISNGDLLAEARSASFNLPSGIKRIASADITPIDLTKYSNEVDRTLDKLGTLPNSEYRICIEVISAETNEVVGFTCNDISVLTLTQPELLSPIDRETVLESLPTFNWLPSVPLRSGTDVTYELIIAEMQNMSFLFLPVPTKQS